MTGVSTTTRIVRNTAAAMAWCAEMGQLVTKKTGIQVDVWARQGSTQDVVFFAEHPDLASVEKTLEAVQNDPEWQTKVEEAESAGYFDQPTIEWGFWKKL